MQQFAEIEYLNCPDHAIVTQDDQDRYRLAFLGIVGQNVGNHGLLAKPDSGYSGVNQFSTPDIVPIDLAAAAKKIEAILEQVT